MNQIKDFRKMIRKQSNMKWTEKRKEEIWRSVILGSIEGK